MGFVRPFATVNYIACMDDSGLGVMPPAPVLDISVTDWGERRGGGGGGGK